MPTSFTISVGDRFSCALEGSDRRLAVYEVLTVSANGAVTARNVKSGKLRQFGGYGRMIGPRLAKAPVSA